MGIAEFIKSLFNSKVTDTSSDEPYYDIPKDIPNDTFSFDKRPDGANLEVGEKVNLWADKNNKSVRLYSQDRFIKGCYVGDNFNQELYYPLLTAKYGFSAVVIQLRQKINVRVKFNGPELHEAQEKKAVELIEKPISPRAAVRFRIRYDDYNKEKFDINQNFKLGVSSVDKVRKDFENLRDHIWLEGDGTKYDIWFEQAECIKIVRMVSSGYEMNVNYLSNDSQYFRFELPIVKKSK
ncbi:MAG: hypothetical protein ACI86C_001938 [Candidatus Latescibacterota bacterium]|jgi:hypothetical protein